MIELYSAAFDMCLSFIHSGFSGDEAIRKTLEVFSSDTFSGVINSIDELRNYLYENISFTADGIYTAVVDDSKRNRDWWNKYRETNGVGQYWSRYKTYLKRIKKWDDYTIERSINEPTDFIMNKLSNPAETTPEECYGAVFGYVQSGKTANYIGLINKAIDAGYKIILVLAGMHNNLRSQTQMRIDEEVLGFETSIEYLKGKSSEYARIGVSTIIPQPKITVEPLTSRDEKGDFNRNRAGVNRTFRIPKIIVAKKQSSVLRNLFDVFSSNHDIVTDPETGNRYFTNEFPILIIDDEADQASINTKYKAGRNGKVDENYDVSKINQLIRQLLSLFSCRSYVGYTATPYANIFIPPEIDDLQLGKDLFPRDFILSLPKPKRYIGAMEFFGEDEDSEIMPLHRQINFSVDEFLDDDKRSVAMSTPDELKRAILSFLLSTAARNVRGHLLEPNSMLVHINRLTDVQDDIYNMVKNYYDEVASYINGGDTVIIDILYDIWHTDYVPTTQRMLSDFSDYMQGATECQWENVIDEVRRLTGNHLIHVREINGKSVDTLCYKEYRDGGRQFNVIAIGGDKLSRGLTLEGLTVSFFMRSTRIYDTLMQMGRWFGFRPGYTDLCRLYVTDELFGWFMQVSYATENLREQIFYMNEYERTPMQFGLRIASHPDMMISSPNKIKTGVEQLLSFNNVLSLTRAIDIDAEIYNRNFQAVDSFIRKLGTHSTDHWEKLGRKSDVKHLFWDGISGQEVAEFLRNYKTADNATKVNSVYMAQYIDEQLKYGGLTEWTVCLKNLGDNSPIDVGGNTIGSGIKRSSGQYKSDGVTCSIKSLKSKDDEYFDFTSDELAVARTMENDGKKAVCIRKTIRKREKGLLILCPLDVEEIKGLAIDGVEHKTPFGFIIEFPDNQGYGNKIMRCRMNNILMESGEDDE